jgi:hypothetical protein
MTAGDDKKNVLTTNDCYFMNITIINTSGNSGLVDSVSVKIDDCTIWMGSNPAQVHSFVNREFLLAE